MQLLYAVVFLIMIFPAHAQQTDPALETLLKGSENDLKEALGDVEEALSNLDQPQNDPEAEAALNSWNDGIEQSDEIYSDRGGPKALPEVGQWAEYRTTLGAKTLEMMFGSPDESLMKNVRKIVGREGEAFWLETEIQMSSGRSVMLALMTADDWTQPKEMAIHRLIQQFNNEPPQELPATMVDLMSEAITSLFLAFDSTGDTVETVVVPAGRFEARSMSVEATPLEGFEVETVYVNAAVPFGGVVLTETSNGDRTELVVFGQTGATTDLLDKLPSAN